MKRNTVIILFYAALAGLALYWPLLHAQTHVPGFQTTDYFHFHWNYWWIRHALTTPGLSVYETNYVLAPFTTNLAYHTLAAFFYPIWALVEPLSGTLVAMNAIFVTAFTLMGCCTFWLLRREGASYGLALLGGCTLQLLPIMFNGVYASTVNILGFFWLPAQLLLWGKVAAANRAGKYGRALLWALAQGAAFYSMFLTDLQYPLFAAFLLLPYGGLTLLQAPTGRARVRLAALGIAALAVMLALLWFAGPLRALLAFDRAQLAPGQAEGAPHIAFPQGFLTRADDYWDNPTVGAFIVPFTLAALAASVALRRRRVMQQARRIRWFWLALVPVPMVLSMGARLDIGATTITLPYTWLHQALGGTFRFPSRLVPVFALPALIFAAQTFTPLLAQPQVRRAYRALVIAAALLFVLVDFRLYEPMPIQEPVPAYEFYSAMGREPYDYVVIEAPVAAGTGEYWLGDLRLLATQFYGITHGKRMINGLISRAPVSHFYYLRTDDPLLSWLGQRRLLEPRLVEAEMRDIFYGWPVGYIVIHQDVIGRFTSTNQEIIGYFNSLPDLLCPVWVERDGVVFRTAWHPDGCPARTPLEIETGVYQIDVGAAGDERYIGWGWHW
ncbi:MAG: hypothetical protein HXY40_16650, partial [Chloroflexi bacterium]|nr:hypothetical protein [Chloroflexota bacterium]